MIHRFVDFEIDENTREVRAGAQVLPLQPRVFDLLVYLARNSGRVVPKDELLDSVWPGVIVTDASLQRAVSLARSALADVGTTGAIRTHARQGYRLCVEPAPAVTSPAPPAATPAATASTQALGRAHAAYATRATRNPPASNSMLQSRYSSRPGPTGSSDSASN